MILEIESLGYADAAGALLTTTEPRQVCTTRWSPDSTGSEAWPVTTPPRPTSPRRTTLPRGDRWRDFADVAAAFATLARLTNGSLANHRHAEAAATLEAPGAVVHDAGARPAADVVPHRPARHPSSLARR